MGFLDKVKDFFYIAKDKIERGFIRVKNALTRFFEKALNMMKNVIQKLKSKVRGVILGCAHFIRKIGGKYQEATKNYSLDRELGDWYETTVTRALKEEDVPPEYQTMEDEFEVNDTEAIDLEIAC